MNKSYAVAFEIEGPAAMFTRPDSGVTPISYPVPTYSAAKAMFEAVARLKSAYVRPYKVEICKPIRYDRWVTNYGGPLRKDEQIKKNNNYQLQATILVDVCYRVHGVVESAKPWGGANNHLHTLQAIFSRRLRKGQWFYTPCLGWKEFTPSYFGPLRNVTQPDASVNLQIPSILQTVFDRPVDGSISPSFLRNVEVRDGIMHFEDENTQC